MILRRLRVGTLLLVASAILAVLLAVFLDDSPAPPPMRSVATEPPSRSVHRNPPRDRSAANGSSVTTRDEPSSTPHFAIEGIVVTQDGEPVGGASVRATRNNSPSLPRLIGRKYLGSWDQGIPDPAATVTSDPTGVFSLSLDEPGVYSFVAEKGRIGRGAVAHVAVPGKSPIRIVLRESKGIPGRVTDRKTGSGVANALVSVWIQAKDTTLGFCKTRSDEDGSFEIPLYDLAPDLFLKTRVRAASYATPTGLDISIHKGRPQPRRLDVVLDRGRQLRVTLVPVDGDAPPAGVKVLLAARSFDFPYQATTDEHGQVVIPHFLPTEEAHILLDDDHWALDTTDTEKVSREVAFTGWPFDIPSSEGTPVEIPVTRAGILRGNVLDFDTGRPVADVLVEVGRFPVYADWGDVGPAPWSQVARTDEKGRFEIGGLDRARMFVKVLRSDQWCNWPDGWTGELVGQGGFSWDRFRNPVDLATQAENHITILARRSAGVEGRVVDERGVPVVGAEIREESGRRDMRQISERLFIQNHVVRTDEHGRFALEGLYPIPALSLHIRHTKYSDIVAGPFALTAGASTSVGDIVVHLAPEVTFFAIGPEGPVSKLALLLTPISSTGRRGVPKTMVTDQRGIITTMAIEEHEVECRFLELPEGLVPAGVKNPIRAKLALDGSDRIRLELVQSHHLIGQLMDVNGNPMADGGFLAHRIDTSSKEEGRAFFADAEGRFRWNVPAESMWRIEYIMTSERDSHGKRRELRFAVKSGSPIEADVPTQVIAGAPLPPDGQPGTSH